MGTLRAHVRRGDNRVGPRRDLVQSPTNGLPGKSGFWLIAALDAGFVVSATAIFAIPYTLFVPTWRLSPYSGTAVRVVGILALTAAVIDVLSAFNGP